MTTDAGEFVTRSLVVDRRPRHQRRPVARCPAAGCRSRSRRTGRARPSTSSRPRTRAHRFTADAMPVIAYLDAGIYCHPIVDGLVDAVKIGYYNPPDMPQRRARASTASPSFVEQCMPGLRDAAVTRRRGRRPVRLRPRRRRRLRARRDPGLRERLRRRRLAGHRLQVRAVGRARARRARARRAAPSTTSAASTQPASRKGGRPMSRPSQRTLSSASLTASSSAPRATSSSSSAAATSRRARTCPR